MRTQNLNMRIDPITKSQAEKLYAQFGITLSDAVNMFLSKSIMVGGLPFALVSSQLTEKEEKAILMADEDIANGRISTHEEVFSKLRKKAELLQRGT